MRARASCLKAWRRLRFRPEAPMSPGMVPRSPLDDPHAAAFAWARYRRIMRWMMLITVTLVVGAVVILYRRSGEVSIHMYIATALGIGGVMLLGSALMGLVFLSSGTGHDESIVNPLDDENGT